MTKKDQLLPPPTRVHILREPYDVVCCRPSKWGNPFRIGDNGDTREIVLRKYRNHVLNSPLLDQLHRLDGKRLACYCRRNQDCHVDIIIDLINAQKKGRSLRPSGFFSKR